MKQASQPLESLLRRARRHIVLQRLLDALPAGLAASALVALVCVGINYALTSLRPAFVWSAALLPTALVLLREIRRGAPTLEEVAYQVDRWFGTDEILTSAWHVQRHDAAAHTANGRRVVRLAERTLVDATAKLRARRIRVSALATTSLAVLAAAALPLGLEYGATRSEAVIPAPFTTSRIPDADVRSFAQRVDPADSTAASDESGLAALRTPPARTPANDRDATTTAFASAATGSKTAGSGEAFAATAVPGTGGASETGVPAPARATRTTRWVDVARTGPAWAGAPDTSARSSAADAAGIGELRSRAFDSDLRDATRDAPSFALEAYAARYLEVVHDD